MRTRKGFCYPRVTSSTMEFRCANPNRKRTKRTNSGEYCRKKTKSSPENAAIDPFDALPDDLVSCILSKLGSSASSPADFATALLTCKRFHGVGRNPIVLAKLSPRAFAVKASNWSENAHRFLKICADAGNAEACYTLGMIRFYCLQNRGSGASLMAKAAITSHAQALYSLAVIQFNGSGGLKTDKDLRAGVALCARASFLGHVDALRELGHCLQDGYGVRQNIAEGRRFLVKANARELINYNSGAVVVSGGCPLMSDFGFDVPATEGHPANRFLAEWFAIRGEEESSGMRLCSHAACGRVETRRHEFRRCSVCGKVNYCSRACQALDWKVRHKAECERWLGEVNGGGGGGGGDVGVVDGGGEVNGES